jgi:hypothetical protein
MNEKIKKMNERKKEALLSLAKSVSLMKRLKAMTLDKAAEYQSSTNEGDNIAFGILFATNNNSI